jgi:Tol biopolymer transport system component
VGTSSGANRGAVRRASLPIPESLTWVGTGPGVAISPDGNWVAYAAASDNILHLYVQNLSEDSPRLIPGSDGAYSPFFSPDSTQVGYVARNKIWRAPLAGSSVYEIGPVDPGDRGAAWSEDGFAFRPGPRAFRAFGSRAAV